MKHVVVHQYDPWANVGAGIDRYLEDFCGVAAGTLDLRLIGVTSTRRRRGHWITAPVGGVELPFFAAAKVDRTEPRRVPHAAQFGVGLLTRRPSVGEAVLHAHRPDVAAVLSVLYPQTPIVLYAHTDLAAARNHRVESYWRFAPRVHEALQASIARRAALVVAVSDGVARSLRAGGANAVWIPNWYDGRTFHVSPASPETPTVGWAGRMEPSKDPIMAINALSVLRTRGFPFRAWIAGAGSMLQRARSLVAERGLGDSVELIGDIPPAELANRLRGTTALLLSSRWEGEPRIVLEALACGARVVSTPVGGLRELITSVGGTVVEGRSEAALAAGLEEVLSEGVDRRLVAETVSGREMGVVTPRLVSALSAAL